MDNSWLEWIIEWKFLVFKKLCIIDEFLNSIFLKISFSMNFIFFQFVSSRRMMYCRSFTRIQSSELINFACIFHLFENEILNEQFYFLFFFFFKFIFVSKIVICHSTYQFTPFYESIFYFLSAKYCFQILLKVFRIYNFGAKLQKSMRCSIIRER